ncbi:hypothetical protein E2C01_049437 [Portunus trituberculatus]|uniref:Uncharacterized protein n=1 Tax=Portunus trituberculatus TaxID=210409 RepID=A0A5B7GD32_PORTR|nr:hypothetical protein [Portunus trituberculatus]
MQATAHPPDSGGGGAASFPPRPQRHRVTLAAPPPTTPSPPRPRAHSSPLPPKGSWRGSGGGGGVYVIASLEDLVFRRYNFSVYIKLDLIWRLQGCRAALDVADGVDMCVQPRDVGRWQAQCVEGEE